MRNRKIGAAVALAAVALLSTATDAGADSTPEVHRAIFQIARPLSRETAFVAGIGGVTATSYDVAPGLDMGSNQSVMVVPFGILHKLDDVFTLQSWVLVSDEFNREIVLDGTELSQSDEIEIRPLVGVTAATYIAPDVEIGMLVRYEARFKDVTGDSDFENRFRLRPYIDATFAVDDQAGTSWHAQFEFDSKYVIGEDSGDHYSFFNAYFPRLIVGHAFSRSFTIDFKYSRQWSRAATNASWEPSDDTFTVQFVKSLRPNEMSATKARIDGD